MSTKYNETKIYLSSDAVEPVTALLLRFGLEEIVVEDKRDIQAIAETKGETDWDFIDESLLAGGEEVVLTFYTEDADAGNELLAELKLELMKLKGDEQYGLYGSGVDFGRMYAETTPLADDWKDSWKEGFTTFKPTARFAIKPTWEDYAPKPYEFVIELDPGMAFGTGTHETTSMCMAAMERFVNEGDVVLDIGAGSGILSIAAAMLGAKKVVAIEIDEDAAEAATRNIERNGLSGEIDLLRVDIRNFEDDSLKSNVVVANLTSGLLKVILPEIGRFTVSGGRLILSGLLDTEFATMTKAVTNSGFTVTETEIKGEWLSICAEYL